MLSLMSKIRYIKIWRGSLVWSKAPVCKTGGRYTRVGSNPTLYTFYYGKNNKNNIKQNIKDKLFKESIEKTKK